jgi:signal transduction histidine kinase
LTADLASLVTIDSRLLGALLLSIGLVALGIFVILHNPRMPVNRRFGAMALTTAGWIATISLALSARDPYHTTLLGRLGFAFAGAIPFSLVWMVDAIAHSAGRYRIIRVVFPGALSLCFVLASLSNLVVSGATSDHSRSNFVYGPLHPLFAAYFVLCFASGIHTLSRTIASASGILRLQLHYLLLGISLAGAGAVATNLGIPLVLNTSRYSALGPYFSLFFFCFFAHAIIRYRLMDIRVVIRQGVVYMSAILVAAVLFFLAAESLRRLAGYSSDSVPLLEALVVAIIIAILFHPLKERIRSSLNRYLYRETYDYQRTVREASRRISTLLDLEPLFDYLTNLVEETFKVDSVIVYLYNPSTRAFEPRISTGHPAWTQPPPQSVIDEASPLSALFNVDKRALVREEAARQLSHPLLSTAANALRELGGDIAFPLIEDGTIAGVIVVGPKRSGDAYFADDIDFLETLMSQVVVAMKNALLYRKVLLVNGYIDNILSTMDSGVIAVNQIGEISLFNAAAERLTRLSASAVMRQPYQCLPAPLASPLTAALIAHTPRSQFEVLLHGPEGARIPLVCSTAILKDGAGAAHGALVVFSDLTRLKALETEKRRAERLASFGTLASGVAHEIKNPLVAIRTFAELLPERFTDSDFREDFAKVVIREISRIDDLVGRLRGLAATAPMHVGVVDIREPISDTLALLRAQFEQTRTRAHCDFRDSSPFVSVDAGQLKQLFLNVLLNSIEAMGTDGEITVNVSRKDVRGTSWIVAEVSDTGPGIPDSVKASIFDPFFTTKPRGSGLGLAICRGITDAHAGAIRADNRLDRRGTTIVIEFPAAVETSVIVEEPVHGS